MKRFAGKDQLARAVCERENHHNMVYHVKYHSPQRLLSDRDFVTRFIWKARGSGFVLVTSPTSTVARPLLKDAVRAEYISTMKIEKINDGETRIEYVCRPDAGGRVPAVFANNSMARFLSVPTFVATYFQKLRTLSNLDEKDGRAIGEALLIKVDAENKKVRAADESWEVARMSELFAQYLGLKEAGERYEWLPGMLARVLRNRLR
jgi:hypothetical protein